MAVIADDDEGPKAGVPRYVPTLPEVPQDPWPGLIAMKTLSFNRTEAVKCVDALIDTIGRIRSVKNKAAASRMPELSQLLSGKKLAQQFNDKLSGLVHILDTHDKMLYEMQQTFIDAGNRYYGADSESADNFGELRSPPIDAFKTKFDKREKRDPNSRADIRTFPASLKGWTEAPSGGVGKYEHSSVPTENPYMWGYNDFHELYANLNPRAAADAASLWHWMKDELDEAFGKLRDQITAATTAGGQWTGHGADKAQESLTKYTNNVTRHLTAGMDLIATNLDYTADFLATTKRQLPTQPNRRTQLPNGSYVDLKDDDIEEIVRQYANVVENNYVFGVNTAKTSVPILQPPVSPIAPPTSIAPPTHPAAVAPVGNPPGGKLTTGGGGPLGGSGGSLSGATSALGPNLGDAGATTSPAALHAAQQNLAQQATAANAQPTAPATPTPPSMDPAQGLSQAAQGMQGLGQAAQQVASMPNALGGVNAAKLASLPLDKVGGHGGGAPKAGGGHGGGSGLSGKEAALAKEATQSRLFPRASLPGTTAGAATGIGRAGMAPMSAPAAGAPGAGAGQGQQRKEHKRANYLDSTEYLDDTLSGGLKVTRPIVDS